MVAAMLASLRDVADDIVVAVDSRVDPLEVRPLVDVADTVVRFEFVHPPELARPWLVGLCRNTSVLMVDGDEVPSTVLVEALPTLVGDDGFVQCRLARRWCFPDVEHWLAERPWWPDYQRRLVRQGPALDFDLRVHGGVIDALPARYVDEPLYHLACILGGFAERRKRVRNYETDRPGLIAVGGGPLNDTMYIPEHFATLRPETTPQEDVALLRRVLEAPDSIDHTRAAPDLPIVSAEEIATHAPVDALAAMGCQAEVAVVEHDRRTEPGNNTCLVMKVVNTGSVPIPHQDSGGVEVRLAARVVEPGTDSEVLGWIFTPLPCDVPVGQGRISEGVVPIPSQDGAYIVEVGLINQRRHWLGSIAQADLLVATRWGRYAPTR